MKCVTRRRSIAAALAAVALAVGGAGFHQEKAKKTEVVTGVSEKGNFDEALANAINNAQARVPEGRKVVWKLTQVEGAYGRTDRHSTVAVKIEVDIN
jgi:hypothetical protein